MESIPLTNYLCTNFQPKYNERIVCKLREISLMKLRATYSWLWLCVLLFCFLSSSALLAQDEPADQTSQDILLLFRGTLNDNDADEGNYAIFSIALNAGDQITAIALCEAAADGARLIDPALTVSAPQMDDAQERQQWYNDDTIELSDCVDYHSAQVSFEAPVSGDYRFVVENLASRSGPFSLEILGSTALQTELDLAPPAGDEELLVESGAEEQPAVVALAADQQDLDAIASSATVTFTGTLGGVGGELAYERTHEILLNGGDEIVAKLICDDRGGGRFLDPALSVSYTNSDDELVTWDSVDEVGGTACADDQANAIVEFTAPEESTYSFTAVNEGANKGRFTLTVSGSSATQPAIEPPLWDGEGTEVPGRWALGEFEGGNSSLIVHLEAGMRVAALAICEEDDNGNRPVDPYIRVLDPNGNVLLSVDDSLDYQECDNWYSAYAEFTADSSGSYTFDMYDLATSSEISSFNARALAETGSNPYHLFVLRQSPQDINSDGDDGNGGGGDNGGGDTSGDTACEGDTLLGKLGEIGCVFSQQAGSGQRIDVYYVDSNSDGHFVLSVNTNNLGDAPASETQIASGSGGSYTFQVYHKTNGDLRVTGGPSSEGKTYEVTVTRSTNSNNNNGGQSSSGSPPANPTSTPEATETPQILAVHVVQAGETLYSIAAQYGVSYQAIADANGIGSDYVIHVGNSLTIPAP